MLDVKQEIFSECRNYKEIANNLKEKFEMRKKSWKFCQLQDNLRETKKQIEYIKPNKIFRNTD